MPPSIAPRKLNPSPRGRPGTGAGRLWPLIAMGTFCLPEAAAHLPHDGVDLLVVPMDLDPHGPWMLLARPHTLPMMFWSQDGGMNWVVAGGPPNGEALLDSTSLDGRVVLLGETRLWWTDSGGADWSSALLPITGLHSLRLDAERITVAGEAGLYEAAAPGEDWTVMLEDPVAILSEDPDVAALALRDGTILRREAADWAEWSSGSLVPTALATEGETVWVGDAEAAVWRLDGASWTACGPIDDLGEGWSAVTQLRWDGDRLWLINARGAVQWSEDRCESWSRAGAPLEPGVGGDGGAQSATEVATALAVKGDLLFVGGWRGLFWSEDAGITWTERPTVGPSYTRGLVRAEDGALSVGAYASGVTIVEEEGSFIHPALPGGQGANVQLIRRSGTDLWAISAHELSRLREGGLEWEAVEGPLRTVASLDQVDRDLLIVGKSREDDHIAAAWSSDEGESWALDEALLSALQGSAPVGAVAVGGERCVAAAGEVNLVCGAVGDWRVLQSGLGNDVIAPIAWPAGGDRFVYADDGAVWWTDDRTEVEEALALQADRPALLHLLADDTILLVTTAGRLHQSPDGALSWTTLPLVLPSGAFAAVDDPEEEPGSALLLATTEGIWRLSELDSAAPRLDRWGTATRIEDQSEFVSCEGCALQDDSTAGMGTLTEMEAGDRMTLWLQGSRLRLFGSTDDDASPALRIDGGKAPPSEEGLEDGTLYSIRSLPAEWHWIELEVEGGGALRIDAWEADGLPPEGEADSSSGESRGPAKQQGGCGCSATQAPAALWLVGLATLRWRRRR